jgi:hypothetical protein
MVRLRLRSQRIGEIMDFTQFKIPAKRIYVTYQCARCGEVDEYIIEMPDGWKHEINRATKRCNGVLIEISRRSST